MLKLFLCESDHSYTQTLFIASQLKHGKIPVIKSMEDPCESADFSSFLDLLIQFLEIGCRNI